MKSWTSQWSWRKKPCLAVLMAALAVYFFQPIAFQPIAFQPIAYAEQTAPAPAATHLVTRFVRNGIALLGEWPQTVRNQLYVQRRDQNKTQVTVKAMPADAGWLANLAWQPSEVVTLHWMGGSKTLKAPLKPSPWVLAAYHWPEQNPLWGKQPDTLSALAFSADGRWLGAGSAQGRVAVWRLSDGKRMFETSHVPSHVRQLAFTPQGLLVVGTQSPEGRIAAYAWKNASTRPVWVWNAASLLGQATPTPRENELYGWVRYPGVFRLIVQQNTLLVVAARSGQAGKGHKEGVSVVVALHPTNGRQQWRWPQTKLGHGLMLWANHASASQSLAATLQPPWGSQARHLGANNPSQLLVWSLKHPQKRMQAWPIRPVDNNPFTAFWRGIGFAPKGGRLAFSSEDGRGFLFKKQSHQWKLTHQWRVLKPIRMAGGWVSATNGQLLAFDEGVVFGAGETYALARAKPPPKQSTNAAQAIDDGNPIHPHGNTLWAYNWQAKQQWVEPLANSLQGLLHPPNTPWLAVLLGGNTAKSKHGFQGLHLLQVTVTQYGWQAQSVYRLPLQGVSTFNGLTASAKAHLFALAEAPRIPSKTHPPVGKNRIWLVH